MIVVRQVGHQHVALSPVMLLPLAESIAYVQVAGRIGFLDSITYVYKILAHAVAGRI